MAEVAATTDRLVLRSWDPADRATFLHHLNTPPVMRWLGGVQDEASADAGFDRIDACQREFGHCFWIVERRPDGAALAGELLGFCGLKRVNSPGTDLTGQHEIGWRLREDAWGQGFAREAAAASLDLAFGRLAAPHVLAFTVPGNVASWSLMERLGMVRRPDLDYVDPRFGPDLNPAIVYRIDGDEWSAAKARR